MNMGADGQAVAVPFGDAVRFEVRPAFSSAGGSFTCPDSNVGALRKRTDPKSEIQGIRNRNEDCSRNLIRRRRMMRVRKARMTVPIGGLPVDAPDRPDERSASGSPHGCRKVTACIGDAVRRRERTRGGARRAANRGDCGTAARDEPPAREAGSGRRRAGRFRQGAPGGGEAGLRCAATQGRVHAARGLPEGSRRGPEGKRSDPAKALRIGTAGRDRVQARAMAVARGEHGPAEGGADGPVPVHRELRESAPATQSRAPGPGCGGASGPADRAGGARGPQQVESVRNAEEHAAPRPRGTGAGTARQAGAAGPSQPGGLNGSPAAPSRPPDRTRRTIAAGGGIRSRSESAISERRQSAGGVCGIVCGCVGEGRKPPVPGGSKRDPSGVIPFSWRAGRRGNSQAN